jgi:putative transposase
MVATHRHPVQEERVLNHSDRGSQYASAAYPELLKLYNMEASMSRKGDCYDNAVMESSFSTLKRECVTGAFDSRSQARQNIFEYTEVWYNRQRRHSALGYATPEAFEKRYFESNTVSTNSG